MKSTRVSVEEKENQGMTRRNGLLQTLVQAQREAEKRRLSQLREIERAQTQAAKAADKAKKDYERSVTANKKERERLYTESQTAQANWQNAELERGIARLEHLLLDALPIDTFLNIQALKQVPNLPAFNPGPLAMAEPPPLPQAYMPPEPTGLQKFLPGTKEKYAQEVAKAQELYRTHSSIHASREYARQQALAQAQKSYQQEIAEIHRNIQAQHA